MTPRVAVVGGGIAGLATAYRLQRAGAEPVVLERAGTHGGVIAPPVAVGDLELEPGPDSLAARKPWGVALCRDLGLSLIPPGATGAFLWTDAGLVPYLRDAAFGIPGDVGDVLRWPGLSRRGRVRALADLVKRKRRDGVEETLGELFRRRLGDEATDRAIAPLLAGLHAGDIDRLSADATFPELLAWESSQGSLIRGAQAAIRTTSGAVPGPLFLRPERGMRELVDALAEALGDGLRTGVEVAGVSEGAVDLADGASEPVDAVVLACGARASATLLGSQAPPGLASIDSVSTGVVFLVYPSGTASALPDGTGFVVPRGAAPMTAATFVSRKWPDARFEDRAVVRCYVGGAGDEERARRRRRGDRRRLRVASRRGARSPRTDRVARPSMAGSDAAVRARPSPSRRGHPCWPAGGYLRRRERVRRGRRLRPRARRRGDGGAGARARGRAPAREDGGAGMTETIYALYSVFAASQELRAELFEDDALGNAADEIETLVKEWAGRVDVRGSYSTVGFRSDADLILWLTATTPEDLQRFVVELRRTRAGDLLDPVVSMMGLVKPAEFTPDHQPAFVRGEAPRTYLCVYPFVRTAEWYLLPPQERGELLAEHGTLGREFPQVLANTTSAFGLGDWEWILAFETDELDALVDCIRRLRDSKTRLFTKVETPFFTGIRKPVADVLDDLR